MKDKLAYQVNGKPKSAPDGVDWLLIRAAREVARRQEDSNKVSRFEFDTDESEAHIRHTFRN